MLEGQQCRGGSSIQIVHIKDTTDVLLQSKSSCLLQSVIVFFEKRSGIRFFSDKKIFTVDAKINQKNDRSPTRDYVLIVVRTKIPANVHVLGVVSNEGDVMSPNFFKKREIITKEVYLRVLMDLIKPDGNYSVRKAICFSAECIDSFESLDSKLTVDVFWSKAFLAFQ